MASISSGSFFHYTKNVDSLLGILHNGFRFSYCFETFDEFVAHSNDDKYIPQFFPIREKSPSFGISFPMVCFCDIPLMRAGMHMKRYGKYCIGLNKNITLKHYSSILNPVFYVNSYWVTDIYSKLTTTKRTLSSRAEKEGEFLKGIESASKDNVVELAGKAKKYIDILQIYHELGFTIEQLVRLTKSCTGENEENFYDEREWRVFWDYKQRERTITRDVHYGLTREEFDKHSPEWNKTIESDYLTFENCQPSEVISHIIVPEEKDVPTIIGAIKSETHILGKEVSLFDFDIRDLLISKVTSFERIENDF